VRRFVLLIPFVLGVTSVCRAQLDTATILGTVYDSSGAVIPQAKIQVQNMGTSVTFETITNGNGNFNAPLLPVGAYRVTASVDGFKSYVQENIRLSAYDRVNLPITLSPGASAEQVTVSGQTELVQTATSTSGGVVDTSTVRTLPVNGRVATRLMMVIPGLSMTGATPNINGASDSRIQQPGIRYQVDGGDSSSIDIDGAGMPYGGGRLNKIGMDAVEEVNMVTDSYSSEFGSTSGALINYISKSGTNNYHGTLFEFFRNDVLDARNYFNAAPAAKPPYRLNQFGGSFGGPIKRDKLFFFANYEGVRQRAGAFFSTFTPTQAFRDTLAPALRPAIDQLPLPNGPISAADPRIGAYSTSRSNQLTEDSWTWRADYQLTTKDRLTIRHTGDDTYAASYFGVGKDQFRPNPNLVQTGKVGYTRAISSSIWNEAAAYINRMAAWSQNAGSEEIRSFPQVVVGSGVPAIGPGTFNLPVANTSYTLYDSLSWIKGRHQLKFGGQVRREWDNKGVIFEQYITFTSLTAFAANTPVSVRTEGWPRVGMRGTATGFFVQDDYKVSSNLTLNLGLRYQYDTVPTESHGRLANFNFQTGQLDPVGTQLVNMPTKNFSPRLGFAYVPFGAKRTVIRGGAGILFASMNYSLPQWIPANIPTVGFSRLLTAVDAPNLVAFPTPDLLKGPTSGVPNINAMQRDYKMLNTYQWSLNVQQQIGGANLLQVGYVGNRTVHLLPGYGVERNPYIPGTTKRLYPNFGMITTQDTCCSAEYNGLQISLKRRLEHGLSLGAHYTWSHAMDDGTSIGSLAFQLPYDHSNQWALGDYDVRHNFIFYYIYEIPSAPVVPKWLGGGWQINGITNIHSGTPFSVICSACNIGGYGLQHSTLGIYTGRASVVPGVSPIPSSFDLPGNATAKQIDIAAFAVPPSIGGGAVAPGNLGRNTLIGPSAYNWDFSVFKDFAVREGQRLEFRYEVFNLFNTPQFTNPQANLSAPSTFGRSFSTQGNLGGFGSQRQMQLGLKYSF
jgi:hypothetical protein